MEKKKHADVFLCVSGKSLSLNHLGPDRTRQQPASVIYIQCARTVSGSI